MLLKKLKLEKNTTNFVVTRFFHSDFVDLIGICSNSSSVVGIIEEAMLNAS